MIGNYPDGIDGSHPHFNQPDAPEPEVETAEVECVVVRCPVCGFRVVEPVDGPRSQDHALARSAALERFDGDHDPDECRPKPSRWED